MYAQRRHHGSSGQPSVCFDFGGSGALRNDIVGSGYAAGGGNDFRVRQRNSSTVRLPGYGGSTTDTAAVISYIQGRNIAVASGTATVASPALEAASSAAQRALSPRCRQP